MLRRSSERAVLVSPVDQPASKGLVGHRSHCFREKLCDLVGQPAALCLWQVSFNGRGYQSLEVVAQHVRLHPPQCGDHRIDLVGDLNAVAAVDDHLLKPAHLALDAPQPRQLSCVVYRHAAVIMFRLCRHLPTMSGHRSP